MPRAEKQRGGHCRGRNQGGKIGHKADDHGNGGSADGSACGDGDYQAEEQQHGNHVGNKIR